jgi:hypothetical protein
MAGKSLIWVLLALALAFGTGPRRALAATAPVPAGTTACNFDALVADPDPAGLAIRAAPFILSEVTADSQGAVDLRSSRSRGSR